MFTGIIEGQAVVVATQDEGTNRRFTFRWERAGELKIDQSVAHNGVCLTVVAIRPEVQEYDLVAIAETLARTNLGQMQPGHRANIERCLPVGGRLDGHFVQGHIDTPTECTAIYDRNGSWECHFRLPAQYASLVVPKGSVTLNGVSLTVVEATADSFSVALIPYTWEHTNLHTLQPGALVNVEFDILGKYVARLMGRAA